MKRARASRKCVSRVAWGALAWGAVLQLGCAGGGPVIRVTNGHVLAGRYIAPTAYEAFLRGALSEAKGDLAHALAEYEAAAAYDPNEPEIWTRVGSIRCRIEGRGPHESSDFATALSLDEHYEPAVMARRACEGTDASGATAGSTDEERRRLEGLTLLHGNRLEAWEELAIWGATHGDVALAVRGMIAVARRAPDRRLALGQAAASLAGRGYLVEARQLAGALLDTEGDRNSGGNGTAVAALPLVARLALDEAVLGRDVRRLYARSARAHLGLEVAAGRAWCAGDVGLARELILPTVKAAPTNLAARLVYEGISGRASSRLLPPPLTALDTAPLPAEVALPFARDLLLTEGADAAMRVLALGGGTVIPPGDARMTPIAVELAIAGVLRADALPPDARIELAARRGVAPAPSEVIDPSVDARHKLFGLALLRPADAATLYEARRLEGACASDPLVAAAAAKVSIARGEPVSSCARAGLEVAAPADPIAASVLLDVEARGSPAAAVDHARQRLAALARTAVERARASE